MNNSTFKKIINTNSFKYKFDWNKYEDIDAILANLNLLEKKILGLINEKTYKIISNVLVELIQSTNLLGGRNEHLLYEHIKETEIIVLFNGIIWIYFYVPTLHNVNKYEELKSSIVNLQALSKVELKEFYKSYLNNSINDENKGISLGFISNIIRRIHDKITFEYREVSNNKFAVELILKVRPISD